jgi:repressor LexA
MSLDNKLILNHMGDQKLTRRQRQILDFVTNYQRRMGYSPSYREIADSFDLSSSATIHEHIKSLEDKGFLKTGRNEARSIELVDAEPNWSQSFELSLAGLITAGVPIEAVEERETISIPASMVRDPLLSFALRVKGESMIEDGILDGDYVVVEKKDSPANGDTVVALIDNQYATLKRFYREKDRIRLQPANKTMKPIFVTKVQIQGVVRGVLRKYA